MQILTQHAPRCGPCLKPYTAIGLRGISYYVCHGCGSALIDLKDLSENFPHFFLANKPFKYIPYLQKRCPICWEDARAIQIDKTVSAFSCKCGKLNFESDPLETWFEEIDAEPSGSFEVDFGLVFYCLVLVGIFFVTHYVTESVFQAMIITGIFGAPGLFLIVRLVEAMFPMPYQEEQASASLIIRWKDTMLDILKDIHANWFPISVTVLILTFIWVSTKTPRAEALKGIAIMMQPEDWSKEASEHQKFFDRLGFVCDFSVAAYRIDPSVLQDWEIKAIRGMCEGSGDTKRWEQAQRYLPDIVDPEEYDIKGTSARKTDGKENTPVKSAGAR